jgi:hypothetical protein
MTEDILRLTVYVALRMPHKQLQFDQDLIAFVLLQCPLLGGNTLVARAEAFGAARERLYNRAAANSDTDIQ